MTGAFIALGIIEPNPGAVVFVAVFALVATIVILIDRKKKP